MAIADKPTELSEQALKSLRDGEKAALTALRTVTHVLDQVVPFAGEGPLARQKVIDAALEVADQLVQTQYTFFHNVVRSAGQRLGAGSPDDAGATRDEAAAVTADEAPAVTADEGADASPDGTATPDEAPATPARRVRAARRGPTPPATE